MNDLDLLIFVDLFKEAYTKCFGQAMTSPLSETESKLFCSLVLDKTGLSIGWKSVKNYSIFIIDSNSGKEENPSAATLDTLARYVLNAPYTTEIQRKNDESHFPYWFLYRERFHKSKPKVVAKRWRTGAITFAAGITVIILALVYFKLIVIPKSGAFADDFHSTDEAAMQSRGWFIKSKDTHYWSKRAEKPGELTLYTLKGDNWPDPKSNPIIKNLLLRPVSSDCFTAEVHMDNFIPKEEWQQAGILLLEDTLLTGKSIRLTLAFNDYFGGMKRPREILVQAITSLGNGFGKPEEIAHKVLFFQDSIGNSQVLIENLRNSALRVEKHGHKYRFLYAGGTTENTAFKEVVSQEFDMQPKYIGIFALKGFTSSNNAPVHFKYFRLTGDNCN